MNRHNFIYNSTSSIRTFKFIYFIFFLDFKLDYLVRDDRNSLRQGPQGHLRIPYKLRLAMFNMLTGSAHDIV